MTLVTNVKGYINGDDWGIVQPTSSLLTYEEIIAMSRSDAVTELNTDVSGYYEKLSSENHIHQGYVGIYCNAQSLDVCGAYDWSSSSYVIAPTKGSQVISYTNGAFVAI